MNGNSCLDQLASDLEMAKQNESNAKERRLEIERKISDLVGVKDEGSHSEKGDYYKITTTGGYSRTLDTKKWEEISQRIPSDLASKVVRQKLELDARQIKNLQEFDPKTYKIVAEAVTTRPRKVAVKIERLEADS